MWPYLILAGYTALLWLLLYRGYLSRKGFLIAALFPAAILLGLRDSSVGEDTYMYLRMAVVTKGMGWNELSHLGSSIIWNMDQYGYGSSVNVGYLILCKAIISVFGNPEAVQVVCALVTCWLFGRFIYRNIENVGMAYWIFLCGGLYMFAFNGMRQMLALAIVVQGYDSLRSGRIWQTLLFIALASVIHTSALVFIAIYGLYILTASEKTLMPALIACLLLPLSMPLLMAITKLISLQYASYFQTNYWNASVGGVAILWLFIFGSLIYLCRRTQTHIGRFITVTSGTYLSLVFSSLSVSILERVALYPQVFILFLFPYCLEIVNEKNRWWYTSLVVLVFFLMFISYAASPTREYIPFF